MERYWINDVNPNARYISKTISVLNSGGVIAYPTGTNYGIGCLLTSRLGVKSLNNLAKQLGRNKLHTILCKDFKQISSYAHIPNDAFRLMKKLFPGSYTVILEATSLLPKVCQTTRKTVGIRFSNHPVTSSLLSQLEAPLLNITALRREEIDMFESPDEVEKQFSNEIDVLLDIGDIPATLTTVIDLSGIIPVLIRQGAGIIDFEHEIFDSN